MTKLIVTFRNFARAPKNTGLTYPELRKNLSAQIVILCLRRAFSDYILSDVRGRRGKGVNGVTYVHRRTGDDGLVAKFSQQHGAAPGVQRSVWLPARRT